MKPVFVIFGVLSVHRGHRVYGYVRQEVTGGKHEGTPPEPKTWAGPLTIGSFVLMAVRGILMFLHLNIGAMKLAHEWLELLFVTGGLTPLV